MRISFKGAATIHVKFWLILLHVLKDPLTMEGSRVQFCADASADHAPPIVTPLIVSIQYNPMHSVHSIPSKSWFVVPLCSFLSEGGKIWLWWRWHMLKPYTSRVFKWLRTHVFVFDMPGCIDDYIHRIGRTARGMDGQALLVCWFSGQNVAVPCVSRLTSFAFFDRLYWLGGNRESACHMWIGPWPARFLLDGIS